MPGDALARVEAVRAIKRLQHAHAHYALAGEWQQAAYLFAQAGELVRRGVTVRGPAAVAAYLQQTHGGPRHDRLLAELIMSPVVTLSRDGRTGKGRWHELSIDAAAGERADWAGGIHENSYTLEDGVWKIARLHYHPRLAGPHHLGWRGLSDDPQLVPYHFSPAEAGTAVTMGQPAGPHAPDVMAARLGWLEDEAAITRIQNAWGYYVDRRQWDDVVDLYAPDGQVVLAGGAVAGQQAIRDALEAASPTGLPSGELNDHLLFAPVVTQGHDGRTASVRGIVLAMTGVNHVAAQWTVSVFDNDFVKHGSGWMIAASRHYPLASTDYDLGWAHSQLADPPGWPLAANSSEMRFPTIAPPPIRFAHPVADRPQAPAKNAGLPARNMERRLAVAAAHDAVENIACAYGYYIDEFRWHAVAELFSAEGWKELSYIGTYVGRDRVLGSLIARYGDQGRTSAFLAIHQKMQPVITVADDARSARMHLRLFQIGALPSGPGPFIGGVYEDEAVMEDGVWKISGMDLDYIWFASYADGWGRVDPAAARQFAPKTGAMDHYPPDGPLRGPAFAPFPAQEALPFHFRNPVSGRLPPLLLD